VAFWLKKAVSFFLMPLPVCLLLMFAGLWLLGKRPHRKSGRRILAAGVILLLLVSNNLVSTWLILPLEGSYPATPELTADKTPPPALVRCRYVVVLGGGHGDMEALPAVSKLSPFALARLTEGVRLLRVLPDARLIVSGPGIDNHPTHASVLAAAAVSLGIAPERIIRIEAARDTEDESQAVRQIVGDAPVALVTSAWHMPRAAALFQQAGVDALPCPADFLAKPVPGWHASDFICEPDALNRSTYAVREYIGRVWLWLRAKA
jgi:uncharacterized SAM-binding protein YcdF (DUF218 family)